MRQRLAIQAATAVATAAIVTSSAAAQPVDASRIDSVFQAYGATGPGCSVGVSRRGEVVLARAYGLADLEHDVPNTATTIFEAGSVSKQITAASIVLLALDGKLALDDDVRKYLPEVPTYDAPIRIRHLLNHTSGLRDWGNVAAIGGWPRTTRVYTNELALDITRRQRALNYTPGQYYSYTNTGYNLLALIVGRVSGVPLAEFARTRLFDPLGMTRTSWRDDFTRIVKGRAIAYAPAGRGTYRQEMPFENAYGNGGLLTTPSDLLRWTANLETGAVGGPRFLEAMHQQARLTSGRTLEYASGLVVTTYRGVREVNHSGSTAGYRAYLTRYPDQATAVAVLCNVANANATSLAHRVADVVLGDAVSARSTATPPAAAALAPTRARALGGTYRSTRDGQPYRLVATDSGLTTAGGTLLRAVDAAGTRLAGNGTTLVFDPAGGTTRPALRMISADGDTVRYVPVATFAPTAAQLAAFAGRYTSDEAENTFDVALVDGALAMRDRYGRPLGTLTPAYPDAFEGPGFDVFFARDGAGRVSALTVRDSRVWALRFARVGDTAVGAGQR